MEIDISRLRTERVDHLGLIAGMCKKLKIAELIDQMLPPNARCKVTHGERVVAMILNGLGFAARTLYLNSEFLEKKPLERFFRPGVKAEYFNDDALGRTLDAVYKHDLTQLYVHIGAHAVKSLQLSGKSIHLDSSSFHVDGEYNHDFPPEEDDQLIHVTRGYSRDHRSDLNQVLLHLMVENSGGLPVLMKAVSGNQTDNSAFKEILGKHLKQLKQATTVDYVVADAALYSEENVQALHQQVKFITRMPVSIKETKQAIIQASCSERKAFDAKLSYVPMTCRYAGVKQRMVVVYSPDNYQRCVRLLDKQIAQGSVKEGKQLRELLRQEFSCKQDAERAIKRYEKKCKWLALKEVSIEPIKQYEGSGRPCANKKPKQVSWRIACTSVVSQHKRSQALKTKGYFVLVTNELDEQKLSDCDVIREYKSQSKVERGFRFLKDPHFIAREFYVKKVSRLMALTFVMTTCLLVYSACEHELRKMLLEKKLTVPNQKKKPTSRPTIRWVFQFFVGIDVLVLPDGACGPTLNVQSRHLAVLQALGPPFEKMYA